MFNHETELNRNDYLGVNGEKARLLPFKAKVEILTEQYNYGNFNLLLKSIINANPLNSP